PPPFPRVAPLSASRFAPAAHRNLEKAYRPCPERIHMGPLPVAMMPHAPVAAAPAALKPPSSYERVSKP
ncbi:MAG: hypothetical protein OXR73_25505, partial [Myxococcales bacterium]|nr:hypothetical protein [Myxococcales bacterium]